MKIKIFESDSVQELENLVNNFLSKVEVVKIDFLQSGNNCWLTSIISYEEKQNE